MAKHWSYSEEKALRELNAAGLSRQAIADAMGKRFERKFSPSIVQSKLFDLGIKGPDRSQAAKLAWRRRRALSKGGANGRSRLAI